VVKNAVIEDVPENVTARILPSHAKQYLSSLCSFLNLHNLDFTVDTVPTIA